LLIVSIRTAAVSPVGNGSEALKSRCPKINLRPSATAIVVASVVIVCLSLFICLCLFVLWWLDTRGYGPQEEI
jgi:hypothetical protein